jgi:DNA-binding MarR family transcriptional regulator
MYFHDTGFVRSAEGGEQEEVILGIGVETMKSLRNVSLYDVNHLNDMAKSRTGNLSSATYHALAEFRYQIRRFLHFSEMAARKVGLEPQQHQLMLAVKGATPGQEPRVAYLAERLQIQHHSAVELVDRLAAKDLIHRVRGKQDRREVHIKLTPQGERVLGALTVDMRRELQNAAPILVAALRNVMTHTNWKTQEVVAGLRSGSLDEVIL